MGILFSDLNDEAVGKSFASIAESLEMRACPISMKTWSNHINLEIFYSQFNCLNFYLNCQNFVMSGVTMLL
jgi:hypothetical protein